MGELYVRANSLEVIGDNGKRRQVKAGKDGSIPVRTVKKDAVGAVQFATAADARGTSAAYTGLTANTTVGTSLDLTDIANFVKGQVFAGTTGTPTVTATLQLTEQGVVLASTTFAAGAVTKTITANNVEAINPNAKVIAAITGGTLNINTLNCLANELGAENLIPA